MHRLKVLIGFLLVVVLALTCLIDCRQGSPRGALMLNLYFAMQNYAKDHGGWLPKSEKDSYDALQKLYPHYCPTGKELAGLSGDLDLTTNTLRKGGLLTSESTSWVYNQGLREDDDLEIAVVWDKRGGFFGNGQSDPTGGHAVLLLSGKIVQISELSWPLFLKSQDALRKTAIEKHTVEP